MAAHKVLLVSRLRFRYKKAVRFTGFQFPGSPAPFGDLTDTQHGTHFEAAPCFAEDQEADAAVNKSNTR